MLWVDKYSPETAWRYIYIVSNTIMTKFKSISIQHISTETYIILIPLIIIYLM